METDLRVSALLAALPNAERERAVRFLSNWDDHHYHDRSPAGLAARLEALTTWIKSDPRDR